VESGKDGKKDERGNKNDESKLRPLRENHEG